MSSTFERDDEMVLGRDVLVTADDLLDGRLSPGAAPAGYERVAELVAAAMTPPPSIDAIELADASVRLAKIVRATRRGGVAIAPIAPSVRRTARSAVVAAAVAFVLTGTAAAASNNLPGPMQSFVSQAASHIGLSVPSPDDDAASNHASNPHSFEGPPSSQPGASAGVGVDQRPACAGNPTEDPAGCAGGVPSTEITPPSTTNEGTGNTNAGDHQGDQGGQGDQSGTTVPTTLTTPTTAGNGQGGSHSVNANTDHPTPTTRPSSKP